MVSWFDLLYRKIILWNNFAQVCRGMREVEEEVAPLEAQDSPATIAVEVARLFPSL